ncbi:MAG: aminotransferase class IV, partial [Desulfofundulus sp.]
PGIMRQVVLETCRRLGIAAEERPVSPHELLDADECFLTNSLMIVMPLVTICGCPVGSGEPGLVTGEIKTAVSNHIL